MPDLLTTNQVQELLHVDRTTIYRMVQSGSLPAIRVGKQWRFERSDIDRWLRSHGAIAAPGPTSVPAPMTLGELLPLSCVQMMQDAFADLLGVMIVITDMNGRPATRVSNPCGLYLAVMANGEAVARCTQDWAGLAGNLSLEPRFLPSGLGMLCTRGLIRSAHELKGMVMLGGIAPEVWPPTPEQIGEIARQFGVPEAAVTARVGDVFYLDGAARERALAVAQRLADIVSHMIEERHVLYNRLQAIASLSAL